MGSDDICIVNAGAHLHDLGDISHIFNTLSNIVKSKRGNFENVPKSIIWKVIKIFCFPAKVVT